MEVTAEAKYVKLSPRKVRLVAEAIKRLSPALALEHLALMPKRAAGPIALVLKSAVANATHNAKLSADVLRIKSVVVGGGPALKRWHPVSRGRAHPYKKRMSHIRVVLSDERNVIPALSAGKGKSEITALPVSSNKVEGKLPKKKQKGKK